MLHNSTATSDPKSSNSSCFDNSCGLNCSDASVNMLVPYAMPVFWIFGSDEFKVKSRLLAVAVSGSIL